MTDNEINTFIADIEGRCSTPDYCRDWSEIGPIIEREIIDIRQSFRTEGSWSAIAYDEHDNKVNEGIADTPTKAAALCYLKMKGADYGKRRP